MSNDSPGAVNWEERGEEKGEHIRWDCQGMLLFYANISVFMYNHWDRSIKSEAYTTSEFPF